MVRVFISQPMRDKTNEEIKKERREAIEHVKKRSGRRCRSNRLIL